MLIRVTGRGVGEVQEEGGCYSLVFEGVNGKRSWFTGSIGCHEGTQMIHSSCGVAGRICWPRPRMQIDRQVDRHRVHT